MPIVEPATYDVGQGTVSVRWRFDLDPEMVWTGLTDQLWVRRWLGTPRGAYALGGGVGLGGVVQIELGDGQVQSVVRSCQLWRRLEVSWSVPGEALSVVDLKLAPAGQQCHAPGAAADAGEGRCAGASVSGTDLTLIHTGVGPLAREYAIGWHAHLIYLAAALRASPMALDRYWEVHERVARAYVR